MKKVLIVPILFFISLLIFCGVLVSEEIENQRTIGVSYYNPELCYEGVNIYCSQWASSVYFVENSGRKLHEIPLKIHNMGCYLIEHVSGQNFLMLAQNNSNAGSIYDRLLVQLNADSKIQSVNNKRRFHHDFDITEDGEVYVLTCSREKLTEISESEAVLNNYITVLDPKGEVKRDISLMSIIEKNERLSKLLFNENQIPGSKEDALDPFHTNTLDIIDRSIDYGNGIRFKKGDVLFCMRSMDTIGVIDVEKEEIVWFWGPGELDRPHFPNILENGNILIFDNGYRRRWSRVVELDPGSGEIVWEYKADPKESFFSKVRGAAQRLPNGNTLVTESVKGHVFEITNEGKVVWEFWDPVKEGNDTAPVIYRMMRISPEEWKSMIE